MATTKRKVYIDSWVTLEKLVLLACVERYGNDWQKTADFLRPMFEDEYLRPPDWYTAETCEAQYDVLVEKYVNQNNPESWITQISVGLKEICLKEANDGREENAQKHVKVKQRLKYLKKGHSITWVKYMKYKRFADDIYEKEFSQKVVKNMQSLIERIHLKKAFEERVKEEEELEANLKLENFAQSSTTPSTSQNSTKSNGFKFTEEMLKAPNFQAQDNESGEKNPITNSATNFKFGSSTEFATATEDVNYQKEILLDDQILQEDLAEVIENIPNIVDNNTLDEILEGLKEVNPVISAEIDKQFSDTLIPNSDIMIDEKNLHGVESSLENVDNTVPEDISQLSEDEDIIYSDEEVDESVVSDVSDTELDDFAFMDDDFIVNEESGSASFMESCVENESHPEVFHKESEDPVIEELEELDQSLAAVDSKDSGASNNDIDDDNDNSELAEDVAQPFEGFDEIEVGTVPCILLIKMIDEVETNFMMDSDSEETSEVGQGTTSSEISRVETGIVEEDGVVEENLKNVGVLVAAPTGDMQEKIIDTPEITTQGTVEYPHSPENFDDPNKQFMAVQPQPQLHFQDVDESTETSKRGEESEEINMENILGYSEDLSADPQEIENAVEDALGTISNDEDNKTAKESLNGSSEEFESIEEEIKIELNELEDVEAPTANVGIIDVVIKEELVEMEEELSEPIRLEDGRSQEINVEDGNLNVNIEQKRTEDYETVDVESGHLELREGEPEVSEMNTSPDTDNFETDKLRYVNLKSYPAAKGKRSECQSSLTKDSEDPVDPGTIHSKEDITIDYSLTTDTVTIEPIKDDSAYIIPYLHDMLAVDTNQLQDMGKNNDDMKARKRKSTLSSGLDKKRRRNSISTYDDNEEDETIDDPEIGNTEMFSVTPEKETPSDTAAVEMGVKSPDGGILCPNPTSDLTSESSSSGGTSTKLVLSLSENLDVSKNVTAESTQSNPVLPIIEKITKNNQSTKQTNRRASSSKKLKSNKQDDGPLSQSMIRKTLNPISKMIILAYNQIQAQKYSNIFQRPITNDQAPGYHEAILKPMDLQTLRRLISDNDINTITKFQYHALLMLNNAIMYNGLNSDIGEMAREVAEATVAQMQYAVEVTEQGVYNPHSKSDQVSKRITRQSIKEPLPARHSV